MVGVIMFTSYSVLLCAIHIHLSADSVNVQVCDPEQQTGSALSGYPSSCASVYIDLPTAVSGSALSKRDSTGKLLPQNYRPWGVKWGSLSHPYSGRCRWETLG